MGSLGRWTGITPLLPARRPLRADPPALRPEPAPFDPPAGRGGPQIIPRPPGTRLGAPPPWARVTGGFDLDRIVGALAASDPYRPPAVVVGDRPPAAVLVPFAEGASGPELIFTRRAWHLRSHRGEISFPGGRREPGDPDLVTTALRETAEEIGLRPADVTVIGELDRLTTVSSPSFIVPVVGIVNGSPRFVPAPDEVDDILRVPLSELTDPAIFREELWHRNGRVAPVYFFELERDTLWGATARIVHNLLTLATRPER